MKRRNQKDLEKLVATASPKNKAVAYYNLGVFHDNNAREADAIPNYEKALKLGLDRKKKSECLAWLASSLYKTGKPKEAIRRLEESYKLADTKLKIFLVGLKKRINNKYEKNGLSLTEGYFPVNFKYYGYQN